MCLLQSKAPPISKIYPTLLFLPVFIMYSHGIFTLLHWSTYSMMVVNGLLEWKRKVGTKRSWLDIMSWLDMHWYRGGKRDESYLAMSLDTLVIILVHWVQKFWYWGGFVAIKTNFCFERHVWTSAKNDTPWKRWEKCLWAWPLCW
jgi:hypothetical protein